MADDNRSIFEQAGFTLPTAQSAVPTPVASVAAPSDSGKSIFEQAGFKIGPAQSGSVEDEMRPTVEQALTLQKLEREGKFKNPEPKSELQSVREDFAPEYVLPKAAHYITHDTVENAAAGYAAAKQGYQEIKQGNGLPSFPGLNPSTWSPGGYLRAGAGALGTVTSPISGGVNALVTRPVTELTGNPDIGDRAGFVASSLIPVKGPAKVAEAVGPETKSVNELVKAIGPENVPEAVARLRENPRLSVADVNDTTRTLVQGMIDPAQPKVQNFVSGALKERQATLPAAVNSAFTETMGPAPDVVTMLEGLRKRADALPTDTQSARAALDSIMGKSADPYDVLQQTMTKRSQEAQPLYEKAFRGGSMAPLESQFEAALSDAATSVSDASKELAAARQQQLLANAQLSRAGDNVYANSSALPAVREANSAVQQAEQKLEAAQSAKQSITDRLRRSQQDNAMNAPGAVWNPRIQQFLDDPITQVGLAKGERIQRLESLAEGKPFNPSEYAITGRDEQGRPIVGSVPNMRTLNVVKKGLDSMVEEAKDPVTGRLSEEGRAVDKVRSSFLSELDKVNPDYKAARQAWAGPTQANEAFNRGLNVFQNRTGASGINSTPQAFESWFGKASDADKEAARIGARSAFEQQMAASSDPGTKAAALAGKEVNQAKLATLFGKDQADHLVKQLNFKFEDPIGKAFDSGFDVLKNRSGVSGLGDRPEALREWMKTATPEEVVARRLGVRSDIDQKIRGVKNQALAGQNITNVEYNQEKLRTLFGEKEANRLIGVMRDAQAEAQTNAKILQGSKTAETLAGREALKVREPKSGNPLQYAGAAMGEFFGSQYGIPGLGLAMMGLKGAHFGAQKIGQQLDLARNYQFARNALATGSERENTINALLAHPKVQRELKSRLNALSAEGQSPRLLPPP